MARNEREQQRKVWEAEHAKPDAIKQMDSQSLSSGIELFMQFLEGQKISTQGLRAVEVCCGKGRNVIALASRGIEAVGLDFARPAIEEAKKRSTYNPNAEFYVQDVTEDWSQKFGTFDIAIDCFALADIEDQEDRKKAAEQIVKALRPSGQLIVYTLSTDDKWSRYGLENHPLDEQGTYKVYKADDSYKFEKAFTFDEIQSLYQGLDVVAKRRIAKLPRYEVDGVEQSFPAKHHWVVLRKSR